MCREFDIHLTQTSFTSDFSNRNADKAGYKTDVALRYFKNIHHSIHCLDEYFYYFSYVDIAEKYPRLGKLAAIKSKELTLKSLII